MFDHVTIRVSDRDASRRFYETLLGDPTYAGDRFDEWKDFSLAQADEEHPLTRNLHVAWAAASREEVDAFWRRGVEAGYRSDGEPGPRRQYNPSYYGGFLLDPDGNSVESVHRPGRTESGPPIDHLWLGVADLEASSRFWRAVVRSLGLGTGAREGLFIVGGDQRHFALVADGRPPTEHVHIAFPVADDEAVAGFHRVALAAGYRDNGGPGERPEYHAGYVGAFVLDPDGNNIEAVNHNR
ncbi:MAG TPA: VOC family protein [Gaiellaceae bacterium]|nr:VOC family protein [Gaiellaceae bacterium]